MKNCNASSSTRLTNKFSALISPTRTLSGRNVVEASCSDKHRFLATLHLRKPTTLDAHVRRRTNTTGPGTSRHCRVGQESEHFVQIKRRCDKEKTASHTNVVNVGDLILRMRQAFPCSAVLLAIDANARVGSETCDNNGGAGAEKETEWANSSESCSTGLPCALSILSGMLDGHGKAQG